MAHGSLLRLRLHAMASPLFFFFFFPSLARRESMLYAAAAMKAPWRYGVAMSVVAYGLVR